MKHVGTTFRNVVLCNNGGQKPNLSPCSHEECDTRSILHLAVAVSSGYSRIMGRTVDTDVVVHAVTYFCTMQVSEIWIAFDTGMYFRHIGVQGIAKTFGIERASVLHLFTAFTGCDIVSTFQGKGKKSAWDTWMAYVKLTDVFAFVNVVVLLFDVHGKQLWSCRDGQLT